MSSEDMKDWFIEPVWQNFSSMYREAITSLEARTGMETAHHRIASLYFGVSALEAFLNQKMRTKMLADGENEDAIFQVLRKGQITDKLKNWPKELQVQLNLRPGSMAKLGEINQLRGNLTHQKNFWPHAYRELSQSDPASVVDIVAEYIVEFHKGHGSPAPYWIFGWNYLNPRKDAHDIILLNEGQLMHSLRALGYRFGAPQWNQLELIQEKLSSGYSGYSEIATFLRSVDRCEPKSDQFPFQPKLCRRWWEPSHHQSCGHITQEAIQRSMEIDASRARPPKE